MREDGSGSIYERERRRRKRNKVKVPVARNLLDGSVVFDEQSTIEVKRRGLRRGRLPVHQSMVGWFRDRLSVDDRLKTNTSDLDPTHTSLLILREGASTLQ
jgi:hypothetical protein